MYAPPQFRELDARRLLDFIRCYPFGVIVTGDQSGTRASHVPVLVREDESGVLLYGHLAHANDHWRHFDGRSALLIFRGPESYISPAWYVSRQMVPTWNYTVAHAEGHIVAITQASRISDVLRDSIATFEAQRPQPWSLAEVSTEYVAQLARAVVAFEVRVTSLEGKFKLSQNLGAEDRQGVVRGLLRERKDRRPALARMMIEASRQPVSGSAPETSRRNA